ncbi:MAG: CmpA/NrtA family ABC transporter substrate-binding protein [Pseudomonadota bacterium]
MSQTQLQINAAFIPLSDCAPLIVAHELGFAEQEGIALNLTRETSWATVRDRLAVAHIDVAHALAPMPLASNLGLGPLPNSIVCPMALGFGGNTVTVSRAIWAQLQDIECTADFDAVRTLAALSELNSRRRSSGSDRFRFGIVHPHSAHRYELAYWLASGGIMPDRDVEFVVLPPSLMATALGGGRIDGFCAGEPWGTIASLESVGTILTSKSHIWRSSPEKVLAARTGWVDENRDALHGLLRALYRSCCWCDQPENLSELAELLARDTYLALPSEAIVPGLQGTLVGGDGKPKAITGFLNFSARAATFPWVSHALWLYAQMVRWGEIEFDPKFESLAKATYRPDIYREALRPLDIPIPSANAKVEGSLPVEMPVGATTGQLTLGPDGFFDGMIFDPDMVGSYIDQLVADDRRNLDRAP